MCGEEGDSDKLYATGLIVTSAMVLIQRHEAVPLYS
jgi:hypothetical protein